MKKEILLLFSILFLLINCNENLSKKSDTELNSENEEDLVIKIGKPYFEYDKIEYFSINIDDEKASDLYETKDQSSIDKLKYDVILGNIPKSINDTNFLNKLIEIGFTKTIIQPSEFEKIDKIFVEKTTNSTIVSACIPIYRDVLVFKNKDRVVGITKICFDCNQNHIVGTDKNIENFGQNGDYEKLEKILKSK